MSNPTHAEFIQGLRELAQFYSEHPEVCLPQYSSDFTIYASSWMFADKEEAKAVVVAAARAFGHAEKRYDATSFNLKKAFSGGIALTVQSDRKTVCKPIVVGKKTVPGRIVPATPEYYEPETQVDDIEWQCEPLLAPDPEPVEETEIEVDSDLPF